MSTDPRPSAATLLISGRSGAGKSTLLEELVDLVPGAIRMPAMTSRAKRDVSDLEYVFTTSEALLEANDRGELVNLDLVHGNYYGVERVALRALLDLGAVPIKEIQAENAAPFFSMASASMLVTVLNDPFLPRPDREESEIRLELESSRGHVLVNLTHFGDPRAAAEHVAQAFALHLWAIEQGYEDPREIDHQNEAAYSSVASRFTDELRVTTANFHEASAEGFRNSLSRIQAKRVVLEIGTGRGWLDTITTSQSIDVIHQESSSGMARMLREAGIEVLECPIRALALPTSSVDVVVGSLIDGLLYPLALHEIHRVLAVGGQFIFSFPSSEWATAARAGRRGAVFQMGNKRSVAYSHTPTNEALSALLEKAGFEVIAIEKFGLNVESESPVSAALFDPHGVLVTPIVTLATAVAI